MKNLITAIFTVILAATCLAQPDHPPAEVTDTNVIAVVLGREIIAGEKGDLAGLIFSALVEKYAQENQIEPTAEELDAFVRKTDEKEKRRQAGFEADRQRLRQELKSSALSRRDRQEKESQLQTLEHILKITREMNGQAKGMEAQLRPMKRQMAHSFVQTWKINKALYAQYGGRVIFQQAGVEPLDAFRNFLREQETTGAFRILDKQYEPKFWYYFTNDAMHTFYPKEEGARLIQTPWWTMEAPPEE